jgi:hypothetical protein
VLPAEKVTVPEGARVVAEVTVAVKVMLCPGFTIDADALRFVDVGAAVMDSVPATNVKL